MTGAIEFLRAWRDLCDEQGGCSKCPVAKYCKCTELEEYTDETITELVRSVMAQSRGVKHEKG